MAGALGVTAPLAAALDGGGLMGARIAGYDWDRTPVGSIGGWPPSLSAAVGSLLASHAQIALFWGPDLVFFHNDAYRPVLGTKEPTALGRPGREVWGEIWDVLYPLLDGVIRTGQAHSGRDVPFWIERFGYVEETYFDISYDPVRSEDGTSVLGVYCIVSETTGRVFGERRLRTLQELGSRQELSSHDDEWELARAAAAILAGNRADLPFVFLYLDGELAAATGATPRGTRAPEVVAEVATTGRSATVSLTDVVTDAPLAAAGRALVLPLGTGSQRLGAAVFGVSRNLALPGEYRAFLDLVAAQVAGALANAREHAAERRRAAELAALDRAKTNFFANVSHEFRTPLTLLLGPLSDLLATESPGSRRDALDLMERNARRLLKLVNDVLDFARLESGRAVASFVALDLAGRTGQLAEAFRPAAERAGLEFTVDCPPLPGPVLVDPEMWDKIVLNLLGNAVKFTLAGGIRVDLHAGDGVVVLTVRDTGVGIPAEELPQLFQRFHRVPGTSRSHEGSGLGLALVQELVEQHGGTVGVTSEVGAGSTFTVSVPLGAEAAAVVTDLPQPQISPYVDEALRWLPDRRPAEPDDEPGEARILLVDDNADLREYVTGLLRPRWSVRSVADATEALAALAVGRYDLVISDVMMPGVDGLGFAERLRADPRTRDLPLILLSARAGEEAAVTGLVSGADDYLAKPFTAGDLLARVRANLELGRLRGRVMGQLRGLADAASDFGTAQSTEDVLGTAAQRARELVDAAGVAVRLGADEVRTGSTIGEPSDVFAIVASGPDGTDLGRIEVWAGDHRPVDGPDRVLLTQLARLTAIRMDNARRYELEHRIATTLQLDLLPQNLPKVPLTRLNGRYRAGSSESAVGGDWYDAIATDGGELVLVVGDVVGCGVRAAATMGQLRNALRVYLLEGFAPADALAGLNRLVRTLDLYQVATVACARFDPRTGKVWFASAGHPPPIVVHPGEPARLLHERALGPPVGAVANPRFASLEGVVEPGARLLLYTDGLIERRGATIDRGLDRLLAAAGRPAADVDDLLDLVVAEVADPDGRDDIALLALESEEPHGFTLRVPPDARRLASVRQRLRDLLIAHGLPERDVFDLTLAVSEAGANAVEHPVAPAEAVVVITARVLPDEVVVSIRDSGRWRPPVATTERGRGLALIRSFADLTVDSDPTGTTVTIRRKTGG